MVKSGGTDQKRWQFIFVVNNENNIAVFELDDKQTITTIYGQNVLKIH